MSKKKIWAVIPARYASTRLPRKPLRDLAGKPLIQRVYENTLNFGLFDKVIVATDDERICDCVRSFGGEAVMTSAEHRSGSDRVWEVVQDASCDIVCNIQGDEPFLAKEAARAVLSLFADSRIEVASAMSLLQDEKDVADPNCVKVVCDKDDFAYTRKALGSFVQTDKSGLEIAENLEQLRFLQNGTKIKMARIKDKILGIDTPADLQKAREILQR